MIKKYCSCVRAVQNNGKNSKEIDDFVREITGEECCAKKSIMASNSLRIIRRLSDTVIDVCRQGDYIVAARNSKYLIVDSVAFESIFEECK